MGQKALPMVESYELVDQKSSPGFKRLALFMNPVTAPEGTQLLVVAKDKKLQLAPPPPPLHLT